MTNEETMETSRTETVGSLLREARLALGLEVRDLAALTKIQGSMIQFLEEDRFEEFPAEVFARGFVRSCARELRLDEDEIVALYRQQTGATAQPALVVAEAPARSEITSQWFDSSTFGVRAAYVGGMALLILGLALSVLVFSGGDGAETAAAYQPADFSDAWQPVPAGANDWQTYREN